MRIEPSGAIRRPPPDRSSISSASIDEPTARNVARRLVTLVQASLLLKSGSTAVAEAFCGTRLRRDGWGATYGEATGRFDTKAIVDRAWPA